MSCGISYCILDTTERSLKLLQIDFLRTREEKYMTEMYNILVPYTKSQIRKLYSHVVRSPKDEDYYAHKAVTLLVETYYRKPEFKIEDSFGGYMPWKIKEAIFHRHEHVIEDVSINREESLDLRTECSYLENIDSNTVMDSLVNEIGDMMYQYNENTVLSHKSNIKRLIALQLRFKFGAQSNKLDKFWGVFGNRGRGHYRNSLNEVEDRLMRPSMGLVN